MIQTYDLPTEDEVLLNLFEKVHGSFGNKYDLDVEHAHNGEPIAVSVIKDGNLCWTESRENLLMKLVYHQSLVMLDQEK